MSELSDIAMKELGLSLEDALKITNHVQYYAMKHCGKTLDEAIQIESWEQYSKVCYKFKAYKIPIISHEQAIEFSNLGPLQELEVSGNVTT